MNSFELFTWSTFETITWFNQRMQMYHFSLKAKNRFQLEEVSPLVSFPTNIGYTHQQLSGSMTKCQKCGDVFLGKVDKLPCENMSPGQSALGWQISQGSLSIPFICKTSCTVWHEGVHLLQFQCKGKWHSKNGWIFIRLGGRHHCSVWPGKNALVLLLKLSRI